MKTLLFFLTLVMFMFSLPAVAVELRDGKLVPTFPQEIALLEKCKKPATCLIVTSEIVQQYAQSVAYAQLAELKAEVEAKFAAAVEARAQELAKQIAKNSI